jgi:hypothetical protein
MLERDSMRREANCRLFLKIPAHTPHEVPLMYCSDSATDWRRTNRSFSSINIAHSNWIWHSPGFVRFRSYSLLKCQKPFIIKRNLRSWVSNYFQFIALFIKIHKPIACGGGELDLMDCKFTSQLMLYYYYYYYYLGAPLLPMWWVKILTFLQEERFLWIISYCTKPFTTLLG